MKFLGWLAAFLAVRFAFRSGVRRGRAVERAVVNRFLHDTVLQALEAFALSTSSDADRAPEKLAELRRAARAQAAVLRRHLDHPGGLTGPGRLGEDLDAVITDLARHGLRAELVLAGVDDTLPPSRRLAIRDATREALRNTLKHADAGAVEVRIEERGNGIAVSTRDHGPGFDVDSVPPGFGISESIVARLAEAGGSATVESRPGWGTRVRLWVPR